MLETGKSRLKPHLRVRHTGSPQMARNRNVAFHRTFVRPACTISAEGNTNFTARLRVRHTQSSQMAGKVACHRVTANLCVRHALSPHAAEGPRNHARSLQRGAPKTYSHFATRSFIRQRVARPQDKLAFHHTFSAGGHLSMDTAGLPLPPKRKVKRTLKSRSSVEVQIQVDHQFL